MARTNNWTNDERGANATMSHILVFGATHDATIAEQYRSQYGSRKPDPEEDLMMAVLIDAMASLELRANATSMKRREAREALEWICDENPGDYPFSFEAICRHFNLDPGWIRKGILHKFSLDRKSGRE